MNLEIKVHITDLLPLSHFPPKIFPSLSLSHDTVNVNKPAARFKSGDLISKLKGKAQKSQSKLLTWEQTYTSVKNISRVVRFCFYLSETVYVNFKKRSYALLE